MPLRSRLRPSRAARLARWGPPLAAGLLLLRAAPASAQDTAAPRRRLGVEGTAGLTTGVPGFGDRSAGAHGALRLLLPGGSPRFGWTAGLAYAYVPLTLDVPDGVRYQRRQSGVIAALGPEWRLGGPAGPLAVDVQWNPTVSRSVPSAGAPSYARPVPWAAHWSPVSLGLSWRGGATRRRYIVVGGRAYLRVPRPSPYSLAAAVSPILALGVGLGQS